MGRHKTSKKTPTEVWREQQAIQEKMNTRREKVERVRKARGAEMVPVDQWMRHERRAKPLLGSIHHLLAECGAEESKFISVLRHADQDQWGPYCDAWQEDLERYGEQNLTHRRTLDELAKECGLVRRDLIGAFVDYCVQHGLAYAQYLVSLAHPEVVEANIDAAKKPAGIQDRRMFFEHLNWIPVPKTQITMNQIANAQAASATSKDVTPLPSFEEQAVQASKVVRDKQ
jgi:hypothetical protein